LDEKKRGEKTDDSKVLEEAKNSKALVPFGATSDYAGGSKKKRKQKKEEDAKVEMTLAISIILANLSCDEEFIQTLLDTPSWAAPQGQAPSLG
jgi:hypothetical protein